MYELLQFSFSYFFHVKFLEYIVAKILHYRKKFYLNFSSIGKLGLKMPQLVNKDITILQTFFEAMSTEDKETQMSVQEALSMMAPAFKAMDSKNLKMIEALVATYIEKNEHQVRQVSVQYAGEVFPPSHVPSKFVLLLGMISHKKSQITVFLVTSIKSKISSKNLIFFTKIFRFWCTFGIEWRNSNQNYIEND